MLFIKKLCSYYGLGYKTASLALKKLGLSKHIKVSDIPLVKSSYIDDFFKKNYVLGDELRYRTNAVIKRLSDNKSYKGRRLLVGLPVGGQRTKSNGKTPRRMALKRKIT